MDGKRLRDELVDHIEHRRPGDHRVEDRIPLQAADFAVAVGGAGVRVAGGVVTGVVPLLVQLEADPAGRDSARGQIVRAAAERLQLPGAHHRAERQVAVRAESIELFAVERHRSTPRPACRRSFSRMNSLPRP